MQMFYVLVVFISLMTVKANAEDVSVETNAGTFIGFINEIGEEETKFRIATFLGIPYAEAPVGDLRFRKPVLRSPMTEPLEVKQFGSPCMHVMVSPNALNGSEDCLFLNIYSPEITLHSMAKIPVMIWIHGGGFVFGSSNAYIPDQLVANGPVIVVTINYRLSVWGFLTTGDSTSPGNYGLWDQHTAIKWVHHNIDQFGGDPMRVTIFGESAGSASVIYQGLYPGNKDLFQRIIGQSGSAFASWAQSRSPLSEAKKFALLAGCNNENNNVMVDCMRGLDNSIINETLNDVSNGYSFGFMGFLPYPDEDFVKQCSSEVDQTYSACRSVFPSFDLLTGITSGEGYITIVPTPWPVEENDVFWPNRTFFSDTLIPTIVTIVAGEPCDVLAQSVIAEYTDWNDPENPEKIRELYCDILTHVLALVPMWRTIDLHARLSSRPSTYMYHFTATPLSHFFPAPSWATKANHGDELIYVFGGEADLSEFGAGKLPKLQDWEKAIASIVMTLWTNFANTGNPNKPRDLGIDWLPYTKKHAHYLDIANDISAKNVKTRLEGRKLNFWNKIVPAIISDKCKPESSNKHETCEKEKKCDP